MSISKLIRLMVQHCSEQINMHNKFWLSFLIFFFLYYFYEKKIQCKKHLIFYNSHNIYAPILKKLIQSPTFSKIFSRELP